MWVHMLVYMCVFPSPPRISVGHGSYLSRESISLLLGETKLVWIREKMSRHEMISSSFLFFGQIIWGYEFSRG